MRNKILLICIFCTLIALVLQTIFLLNVSSNMVYEQARDIAYNSLDNMQNELGSYIEGIENNMVNIYNDKAFLGALRDYGTVEELRQDYYRYARDYAEKYFTANDGMMALYFYNSAHEIISVYRKASTPKRNYAADIYEEAEVYNAERVKAYTESSENKMLISSYHNSSTDADMMRFVLKLYDTSSKKDMIGYIVCDADVKAPQKIMQKYQLGDNTFVWLQPAGDRAFGLVGEPGESYADFYGRMMEDIQENRRAAVDMADPEKVFFHLPIKKYELAVYAVMPQSVLKASQKILERTLVISVTALSALMIILYTYITKRLTNPLANLMDTIGRIRGGDTNLRVNYQVQDEIGKLGEEFNYMLDSIENLIGQQYQDKLLLNRAQYQALQAQINPHFLYNTLDTMSSIASIQNCDLVSDLCQSLSNIFRYSLDMKYPYATVSREIAHLKNYIFVMNVRMRQEIRYHFDIDDDALLYSVPKISIQPLVENAINHGLKNKRGEKNVYIKIWQAEGKLYVMVRDDGVGMDAEKFNRLLKENDTGLVEEGDSIGLLNINARLKMIYGEEYGLFIESEPGKGSSVYLSVAARKEDELYGKENV
ncbi:MAG: sensor histidine kinase [Lachnospiraceae bacterium]|nr:sensor histidine kinase [Lachnospiraceae bacterium]